MTGTPRIKCPHCGKRFKRRDHLNRHQLTHEQALYRCGQISCGMAFHRQDVLHRHEQVHRFDPSIRRRRPRRGINPLPIEKSDQPADLWVSPDEDTNVAPDKSKALQPADLAWTEGPPAPLPLSSFDFCFLHYQQVCVRRWPFIHHTWLSQANMLREKQLAMAALGGCVVVEYRQAAKEFFHESRSLLSRGRQSQECQLEEEPSTALDLFQMNLLLLEYALWSVDDETKRWAVQMTFKHASLTIPRAIQYLEKSQTAEQNWSEWVHEEQWIRALWTFYSLTQKAMHQFPCFISTFRVQQHLRLPRSDICFNATDEQTWLQCRIELSTKGVVTSDLSLKSAIQHVQSSSPLPSQFLSALTPMARHLVLVALFENYTNGVRHLCVTGECSQSEAAEPPGDPCPVIVSRTLCTIRSLWWVDPGELFTARPPRLLDLQNVLLLNHLEVFALTRLSAYRASEQRSLNLCTAASICTDILASIYDNGLLDIATKASWLADAASKRYVVGFARLMVQWANKSQCDGTGHDDHGHGTLHERVSKLLDRHEAIGRNSAPPHFKEAVERAWTAILHCPAASWRAPEDLKAAKE